MSSGKILWIDDETENLKSHILFLQSKGYEVFSFSNGYDALNFLRKNQIDVVLLDETMPGMSGLETLVQIKLINTGLPVIMVTKNEAENVMEEAIGSQITDYLIKPVNPNQILLSLKKILENKRLVSEKTALSFQQELRHLFSALNNNPNAEEWKEIYRKLVYWELEIDKTESSELKEILQNQKEEANAEFFKFIQKNYKSWFQKKVDVPLLSHEILVKKLIPNLVPGVPFFLLVIDNLRFDQWKAVEPIFSDNFRICEASEYYSILPTATQYARNSLFAGLPPAEISRMFPQQWKSEEDEGSKNAEEFYFFNQLLKRHRLDHLKTTYHKILSIEAATHFAQNIYNCLQSDINIIVCNFVDMLSHARTEIEILKELASDERSYRYVAKGWLEHSLVFDALKKISNKKIQLAVTTDHGSIRVKNPIKVIGDKHSSTNIRYKHGKNLSFDEKTVFVAKNPSEIGLPTPNISSSYIFSKGADYLCYPNQYNHFANYYRNSFQHGGISLEEMIIPWILMESK